MKILHSEELDTLFKAILELKNINECRAFFEDLCTVTELSDMSQRFKVAQMLYSGESYIDISNELGVSSTTISRVAKALNFGDGYITAIKRTDIKDTNE